VCADILPGYGDVYLFGDFNVNVLDSFDGLFETCAVSGKLLDLFLISNKSEVVDFFQMLLSWIEYDMLFLAQQRPAVGIVERHVRSLETLICPTF
jgi:hypothetical protein